MADDRLPRWRSASIAPADATGCAANDRNLLESPPKGILETNARLVTRDDDGALEHK
jgi:hypothetical protein